MADHQAANVKIHRQECKGCGRQFVLESLQKHQPICLKSAHKKRKVFDSTKQRSEGSEVSYRQMKTAQKKEVKAPRSNWRAQHEDFINTIRSAKHVSIAMERGEPLPPPPPPSINPDYVQCPHCSRRFNAKAADRHMSFCKEQQKRLGSKPVPSANAKAKMDARNSYQPPKLKGRSPAGGVTSSPGSYNSSPGAPRVGVGRAPPPPTGSGKIPIGATGTGYGRQPAAATRGRPSPSTNQYQASNYGDQHGDPPDLEGSPLRVPSGRVLRTGRNADVYNNARKMNRPGSTGMPKSKSASSIRAAAVGSNGPVSFGRLSPSMPSGFTGGNSREAESGYYSSSSENEVHSQYPSKPSLSRFCYECGTKYPVSSAKFCCECGVRRIVIS